MKNRGFFGLLVKRDPRNARRSWITPWLWLLPALFFVTVFLIYPVIDTFRLSFYNANSTPELIRLLANFMDVPSRLFPCPPSLLRLAGRVTGKSRQIDRLLGSLRVDSAKIRRDLNWVPPYSLQQGLQATAEWYRDQHT